MFQRLFAAISAAWLFCGMSIAGPAPISTYGQLPTLEQLTLSPDGGSIAYIKNVQSKRYVVVQRLGQNVQPQLIDLGTKKLRWLQWASPDDVIFTTSETTVPRGFGGERHEYFMAQSFNAKTGASHLLLDHVKGLTSSRGAMNTVAGQPILRTVAGKPAVFITGVYFPETKQIGPATTGLGDNYGQYGLFRYDLETGETRLVSQEGRKDVQSWVLDEAGNILAEEDYTLFTQHWKLVLYKDGKPDKTVMDVPAPIEGPNAVGLSPDGSAIIVEMPSTAEGRSYRQVSLKDGEVSPWRPDLAHAGNLLVDDQTGRVSGVSRSLDRRSYVFFDPSLDTMWKSITAAFAAASSVDLESYSTDKTKAIVEVFGPSLGYGYFFLDRTAKKAYPVASAYDGLTEIYEKKWITYKAADGREIPAYLTLPKRDTKNLPLIVLPHGGPHSRDRPGFDWWSQAFASRGYAVLQPQFRGSAGFGREWLEAGFHQIGWKMQTDLSDGVRALAAQGLIDPKRVCITGASYGGYAAMAGPTLDPGVYRCAVAVAGVFDMREMLKGWPKSTMGAAGSRFWDRFVGIEDGDMTKADAISPAKFADRVTIPVMLIHGKDDTVVPYKQSEIMADALKAAGKPYDFVTLEKEDHWLSTGATRQKMLEESIKFIEKHNPPN